MKKITSLQFMMLMSLALGTSFVTECYGKQKSESSQKEEKCDDSMKSIEKDLRKIRKEFEKSHDRAAAHAKLHQIEKRIKALIKNLKRSEKHGKVWETHEHTLNRKLREVREFVNKGSQE